MNTARRPLILATHSPRRAQTLVLGSAALVVGLVTACTVKNSENPEDLDPSGAKASEGDSDASGDTDPNNPNNPGNMGTAGMTGADMTNGNGSMPDSAGVGNSGDTTGDNNGSGTGPNGGTDTGNMGGGGNQMPHLQFMVVEPSDQILEMGLSQTTSINYQAFGFYSDGRKENLSDKVNWSLTVPEVGAFANSTLNISGHANLFVKTSKVRAELNGIESFGQVTVAAYNNQGAKPDFLFILPYQDKGGVKSKLLNFATKVPSLDVFFSVDATGSMGEERDQLKADLSKKIIPQVKSNIADTQFGVGVVQDYPIRPFGRPNMDQPFRLLQSITSDVAKAQAGVDAIKTGSGYDDSESILEGLYQISTGDGLTGPAPTNVPANKTGVGGVDFREGTMPVIISITDASSHAPGEQDVDGCGRGYENVNFKDPENGFKETVVNIPDQYKHTRKQTEDALEKICARVITVASEGGRGGECDPSVDGVKLANVTKSRVSPLVWDKNRPSNCPAGQCCTGKDSSGVPPEDDGMCSLVYRVDKDGNGLGDSIVEGIKSLAFFAPFDVKTESKGENTSVTGKPLPANVTTVDFIESVVASSFGKLPLPGLPNPTTAGDHFKNVTPGTPVNFEIKAFNDVVRPTTSAQVYRAKIGATADQCVGLELDQREVIFVVPPKPLVAG